MAKNNLLIFSGANRRYKYLVNKILDKYPGVSLVVQENIKGDYKGKYDDNDDKFDEEIIKLFNSHLEKRDEIEAKYFSEDHFHLNENNKVLRVTSETLNSNEAVNFIKKANPSVVLSFGVGLLKKEVLNVLKKCEAVNLHLGLSPHYRSSDTLLWPLYLQNPGHVGTTLHKLEKGVDDGSIYHQQETVFNREDSIHDIFCKTITQSVKPALKLIDSLMKNIKLELYVSPLKGKFFFKGEFTPVHLKIIYMELGRKKLESYCRSD